MTEDVPEQSEETPEPEPSDAPVDGSQEAASDEAPADEERAEPAAPEEVAEVALEFLQGLLGAMDLEAEVTTAIEDERATASVAGPDLGLLIGRRGQTLDALQELTRTAVQRKLRTRVRLLVDVEGYRARRRASLEEYAISMARRAIDRGTEIELEAMSAYERKVCHDAIATVEGASSFSEGEEPNRKVVVRGG
jgi:spoIIIJ-associated protein